MKTIYVILLFLVAFQGVVLVIHVLDVFPQDARLYSDLDVNELQQNIDKEGVVGAFKYIMGTPGSIKVIGFKISLSDLTLAGIVGIFIGGAIVAVATHSFLPVVYALFIITIIPMFTQSRRFFEKIFTTFDSTALVYLGIVIFLMFMMIILFTLIENATHGRS